MHCVTHFLRCLPPRWHGQCWYYHNRLKYEFAFEFEVPHCAPPALGPPCLAHRPAQIPAAYPAVSPEIKIPELDGKTVKMYRCGTHATGVA